MARPVSLRLRHPRGALQLNGLDPATTLEALRTLIAQRLELPPTASFHLLRGTPPKELTAPLSSTLGELKLAGGTRHREDAAAVPAPAPAPAPVSKPAPAAPAPAPAPKSEPAPAPAKPAAPAKAVEPLVVGNDEEGYLVRRVVDSDNSCLFTSIGFVLENHDRSHATAQKLRKVIADAVRGNEAEFSEAVLGKPPAAYCDWIQRPESWGGAIELAIFAKHYRTEIAAFDLTTARHQVFGVDGGYSQRVLLMYDGIHYDPLALSFGRDLPEDLDQTIFALTDTASIAKATAMCQTLHKKRQFTNTGNFTLRCGICQEGFTGEKAAVEHAQKTGHTNFSEFK